MTETIMLKLEVQPMDPTSSYRAHGAGIANDRLLSVPFANIDLPTAKARITAVLEGEQSCNLFFINAHCLNLSYRNPTYHQALLQTPLVLPDGSGVKKGCELNGGSLAANLNGTDLFPHICEIATKQNAPVYLLGAQPGVAEKVSGWIHEHYPGLRVAGTQHGYFSNAEEDSVVENINQSGAEILIVAMGVPTQELWLHTMQDRLNTRLNIAVGGLFDFYSGRIPRAPAWLRNMGFEWVWRFLQEPRRMWRRYLIGNVVYLSRVRKEARIRRWVRMLPERLIAPRARKLLGLQAGLRRALYRLRISSSERNKRLSDLVISGSALLFMLPVFLFIAIAIKLESPGPIFFGQTRAGIRGRPFRLWKFRSMVIDAEAKRHELEKHNEIDDGVTFKIQNDPRVTRVGRIIRKLSLDELPQLVNVLKGEMSIVGPRPGLYDEVAKYQLAQRMRLDVKPGLTSEWVVSGRNNLSFSQQAELDVAYRNHRSLWLDCKLMIKTIPALLTGRGAS
ncbi:WecB/TagA/CpsF family glycosyltransferase [Marinobacter daepoensis]|uniref:WecB/TagA/CpsF family glycosyltransferase n=1 Tax=Marinobacter daepoensis TaxID=262077 RepID=UPI001C9529BE|nr:WecB/TagA/CpsF family glycosyltransferase [Marinobacter daepoensis]